MRHISENKSHGPGWNHSPRGKRNGLLAQLEKEELRAAQEQLELSREHYAQLYHYAPVGHLTLDQAGVILDINIKAAELLGRPAKALIGWPLLGAVDNRDQRKFLTHLRLSIQQGECISTPLRLAREGKGDSIWVELLSLASRSEADDVLHLKCALTDITARKQGEDALRESEARFRTMADFAPVLIWISGKNKRCTYFNRPWLEFTGRSLEAEWGNGWTEGIHPEDRKRCLQKYREAFDSRQEFRMEYRLRRHDGVYRWILDSGVPRYVSTGEFVGYIGSCIDITERREIEAKLEVMSRFPLESPSPVIRLDEGRILRYANPAAQGVMALWKTTLGKEAPGPIARIAGRALKTNVRQTHDIVVGKNQFQVQFAPVPSAGYVNLYFSDITERNRSEQALRESESRFRTLASHAPVGIFMSSPVGEAIYVNERWCQMAGLKAEEAMGKGWLKAVHPGDRQRVGSGWKLAVRQGDSSSAEFRFRRPDGSIVWIHGHATRLKNSDGRTIGYIGTVADITARRNAEAALQRAHQELEDRVRRRTQELIRANASLQREIIARQQADLALRESEERLRLMIEGTQDYAFFMLDPQGRVATWNTGAQQINGYRAKEILGCHFSRFYPPRERRQGKPKLILETARRTGRAEEEGWRCRKRGEQFWASTIITALRDAQGRLRGYLKVTRDVTETRKIQEELRSSARDLTDFFNHSPLGLLWVTPDGCIRRVNQAALELFGCSLEECLSRPVPDLLVEPEAAAEILNQLTQRAPVQNHRARFRRPNGSVRHVLIDANGLWERGRMVHSRWFVRDITRQVELEREILSVAEQERQRLGQDLHDDLCQQLTGIEFLSQTLAGQLASSSGRNVERAREIARMIRQAITHTRDLAHGLSPTELEADGLIGALHQLADRTRAMFRVTCQFHCKVPVEFKDTGLGIHLYRIAQEAVTNAVKHGKARRVDISLARNKKVLRLAVADNGAGLPSSLQKMRGMGLRVMQYRAGVIGGTLELGQNAAGGTTVTCSVSNTLLNHQTNPQHENK
jgi:PAS domain S-box-containing protein